MNGNNLPAKARILLASDGACATREPLRSHGYEVILANLSCPTTVSVRLLLQSVEIVLVDVTLANRAILATIHDLSAAIRICDIVPRLLCFSTAHRNAQFILDIEKCGAKFVRIGDMPMLTEAIETVLADIEGLRRNGPYFEVRHRFALGCCAPGESVDGWFYPRAIENPQLHVGLSERLILNVLAEHRRVALDARQIVATLNGELFYREHGANSGMLQLSTLRVPTVKVAIGRVRDAMIPKFDRANDRFDPFDVVMSVPVVGSNRVLYKLNPNVTIHVIHSTD